MMVVRGQDVSAKFKSIQRQVSENWVLDSRQRVEALVQASKNELYPVLHLLPMESLEIERHIITPTDLVVLNLSSLP